MAVRLALKRNVHVGVAGLEVPVQPLSQIDEIEQDVSQFLHLGGVDFLVVQQGRGELRVLPDEKHSKQVHCVKPIDRHYAVANHFH